MSRPQVITAPSEAQQLKTTAMNCGGTWCDTFLITINADHPAEEALALARKLANGVELISKRLYDQINESDAVACIDEIAAVGFLGGMCAALVQSVARGLPQEGGAQ
jgi:hypothetical protein